MSAQTCKHPEGTTNPTVSELMARARSLTPVLRERAQATEDNRRLPVENVQALIEADFLRISQPAQYGGYEMHPRVFFDVAMELAKGCASTAWFQCLMAVHNWEMALLGRQACDEVWGQDPDVRISSSYAPFGKVERVEGGYRLRGRWPWSSGSDHCQWAMLGGMIPAANEGEMPEMMFFLVPRAEYQVVDTWHVSGLCGTGSNDIVVDDAFVPAHRTQPLLETFMMTDRGLREFTAPVYKLPFGVVFATTLAVITQGIAEGALEEFKAQMKVKTGAYEGNKYSADPFILQRIATADAMVRGNRLRLADIYSQLDECIARGDAVPTMLRARCKFDVQFLAKQNVEAVNLVFKSAGGSANRRENPLQRYFRDIEIATNHAFLNYDKGSVNYGGMLLGSETTDFVI